MAVKYYGLCETCEHDPNCTLRRSLQLKIIQCEEYVLDEAGDTPPVTDWIFEICSIKKDSDDRLLINMC